MDKAMIAIDAHIVGIAIEWVPAHDSAVRELAKSHTGQYHQLQDHDKMLHQNAPFMKNGSNERALERLYEWQSGKGTMAGR